MKVKSRVEVRRKSVRGKLAQNKGAILGERNPLMGEEEEKRWGFTSAQPGVVV